MNKAGRPAQNGACPDGSQEGAGGLQGEGFLCLDLLVLLDQSLSRAAQRIGAKSMKGIGVYYPHQPLYCHLRQPEIEPARALAESWLHY